MNTSVTKSFTETKFFKGLKCFTFLIKFGHYLPFNNKISSTLKRINNATKHKYLFQYSYFTIHLSVFSTFTHDSNLTQYQYQTICACLHDQGYQPLKVHSGTLSLQPVLPMDVTRKIPSSLSILPFSVKPSNSHTIINLLVIKSPALEQYICM